jgi:hypothetical protein
MDLYFLKLIEMRKITILIVTILVMFSSCKKDNNNNGFNKITVQTRVLSQDEKNLVEKMKCAAIALKETMKKDKELSGLFKDEIHGLYNKSTWKEAFSLKQLLNPNESVYKSLKTGTTTGVSSKLSQKFATGFIMNLKSVTSHLKSDAVDNFDTNVDGLQVYYPYSEEFLSNLAPPNFTYTFAPLTNDAQNYGWVYDPVTDRDVIVLVNDDYAFNNPTLIVMQEDFFDDAPIMTNPVIPSGNVNEVHIGSIKCDNQYGELFTGGPVICFLVFLPGDTEKSYTSADQVSAGRSTVPPINFSRKNVRRHEWIEKNDTFIPNWRPEYITTHWACYEDDSHNWGGSESSITFDSKVTYKPIGGVENSVDVKYEIKGSGNDKVGELTWDRDNYFATNNLVPTSTYMNIPPYEVRLDPSTGINYRIYQIGAVHFTLPLF